MRKMVLADNLKESVPSATLGLWSFLTGWDGQISRLEGARNSVYMVSLVKSHVILWPSSFLVAIRIVVGIKLRDPNSTPSTSCVSDITNHKPVFEQVPKAAVDVGRLA